MAKKLKDCFPMIREENELLAGFWEALRRDLSFMPECGGYHGNVFERTAGTGIEKELRKFGIVFFPVSSYTNITEKIIGFQPVF